MIILLQTASSVVGGLAFAVMLTIILVIMVGHFARRERSKRITRVPPVKGIDRSRRRMELSDVEVEIEKIGPLIAIARD